MNEYKIIFTGTMGAGKTTAIAAVSDAPPIMTDVTNNDRSVAKELTTVGFDYGQVTLDNGDRIRMYGTPGQERFKFIWQAVSKNALGLILLTDNTRPDPIQDMYVYLDGFAKELQTMPCVLGIGRMSEKSTPDIKDYIDAIERKGYVFPVLEVDVRKRDDVVMLIDVLLSQLEADLDVSSDA